MDFNYLPYSFSSRLSPSAYSNKSACGNRWGIQMVLPGCPDPVDWIFYYINIQVRTFAGVHLLTVAINSGKFARISSEKKKSSFTDL